MFLLNHGDRSLVYSLESVAPKLQYKQDPVIQIQSNGHNYELNPNFRITHDNYIRESNGSFINRPSIEGYANRCWSEGKYHNFPRDMDNTIVNQGIYMRQFGIRLEQRELIGVLNTIPLNSLRFVIEETICSKCSDKVHQEIVDRPVSGVYKVSFVL